MKTLILLLIVILTSCAKHYRCDCTLRDPNQKNRGSVTYTNDVRATKKSAAEKCDFLEEFYEDNERDCYIVK